MKRIGFIGSYDKTDFIIYVAKILVTAGQKVLVIDSTVNQKAKYVVPVIKPSTSYITEYENIDVAVGFDSIDEIKQYLGVPNGAELNYDIALIDVDTSEAIDEFQLLAADKNYFVTSFDTYSLKRGLEALSGLPNILKLTKILFSMDATKEEEDYLNYLALGYKVEWEEEQVYFPLDNEDRAVIIENQRVARIKLKKLSSQYKEALMYIAEQILGKEQYSEIRKIFKLLEKGA